MDSHHNALDIVKKIWMDEEMPSPLELPTDQKEVDPEKEREEEMRERVMTGRTVGELLRAKPPAQDDKPDDKPKQSDDLKPDDKPKQSDDLKPDDKPKQSDDLKPDDKPKQADSKPDDKAGNEPKPDESKPKPAVKKPIVDTSFFDQIADPDEAGADEVNPLLAEIESSAPLDEEERKANEFWQFAESKHPDLYKGFVDKNLKFLSENRKARERFQSEDPDTPLAENENYLTWVKEHRPKIDRTAAETLKEDMIVDRAERKAEEKFKQIRKENDAREIEPKIEAAVDTYRRSFTPLLENTESPTVKAMIDVVKQSGEGNEAAGAVAMIEQYPEQGQILAQYAQAGEKMSRRWLQFRSGVTKLDANSEMDLTLVTKLNQFESEMMTDAHKARRVRNGKQFASLKDYTKMNKSERDKHWTFSSDQFLQLLSIDLMNHAVRDVDNSAEKFKKAWGALPSELKAKNKHGAKADEMPPPKPREQEEEEVIPAAGTAPSSGKSPKAPESDLQKVLSKF